MKEISLGCKVKDTVTELEGTVVGACEYLRGSISFQVQPPLLNGKMEGSVWIEKGRLERI